MIVAANLSTFVSHVMSSGFLPMLHSSCTDITALKWHVTATLSYRTQRGTGDNCNAHSFVY